jgi:hypothetical protein
MTTETDLTNMLSRLVEMQKAAYSGSDAVPVSFYAQEATPYWTTRIDSALIEEESENLQIITYSINMRLVLASVTEGWDNEAEKLIATWLPTILLYFGQRRQLKRTSADTSPLNLDPRGSLITSANADYSMQNSGVGVTQFGIDFTIEVPMTQQTDQVI